MVRIGSQPPRASAGSDLPAHGQPVRRIDLMTVPEVAEDFRTSPKAIYTMIERGQLPGVVRFNRRVLGDRQALLDWLRQKSTPSLEQVGQR
jgi:hypothetical protein